MPRTYGLTTVGGYRHQLVKSADKTIKSIVKKGIGELALVEGFAPNDLSNISVLDMSIDSITNFQRPNAGLVTEVRGTALFGGKIQHYLLRHYGEYHAATIRSL